MSKKSLLILGGLVLVHLLFLFNLSFTAWPEMLAWPYFILKGWFPYKDFAMVHTPLLVLDLALFNKIFGIGATQLKIFGWVLILLTDLTLFYVVKKLWSAKTALYSLLFFVPLQLLYDGNGIWFDYALSIWGLLALYLLLSKRYLAAGAVWALAFFTKQTAVWFLFPISFVMLGGGFGARAKKFILGAFYTLGIGVFVLWIFGILPDFIFWAIRFGIGILPQVTGQISSPTAIEALRALLPFSILVFALFIDWKKYLPFAMWAGFGILGAIPRWELFHFQPGLPFLAITIAIFFLQSESLKSLTRFALALYIAGVLLMVTRSINRTWGEPDRFLEPSVLRTADYIKANTKESDRIFVLNSWDNLYALSDRLPATRPWFPQLPWYFAIDGVEDVATNDLKTESPSLVVMQPYPPSGLSSFKPVKVTDYIFKFYQPSFVIDNSFYILTPNK